MWSLEFEIVTFVKQGSVKLTSIPIYMDKSR